MDSTNILSSIMRWALTMLSALWAVIEPSWPYLALCTAFVFLDVYSAFKLARRVHKAYPDKATGKLRSEKMHKVIPTLIEIYAVVVMAYYTQIHIASGWIPFDVAKVVCAGVCGYQLWSYIENTASCNGAKWAVWVSKLVVDKTHRHFDIDMPHTVNAENYEDD